MRASTRSDLEATLDDHFDRLVGVRPRSSPALHDELQDDPARAQPAGLLARADRAVEPAARRPVGAPIHVARAEPPDRRRARAGGAAELLVTRAIAVLGEIASTMGNEFDTGILQQLDDLQVRLAEQARDVNRLESTDRGDARADSRLRGRRLVRRGPVHRVLPRQQRRPAFALRRPRQGVHRLRSGGRPRVRPR